VIVAANGLEFHVEEAGTGTPVLLLHGFPDTSAVWRHQLPALADAGFRAIAPDLRGRGRTTRPEGVEAYAMPQLVGDVLGLLDALEIERVAIVSHDWGAALAWVVAALAPDRVERLVAMSVGFPGATRPDRRALEQAWYRILFLSPDAEEAFRRDDWFLARILFGDAADFERYLADLADPEALTAGLNWYRANLPALGLAGTDRPALPPVAVPTLGIFGADDAYLSERAMLASAAYVADWRYERIENAGHWLQLDQPERVNALLTEFLEAV
jgi:pimeloyl-ACP methyl ester carboxylesterase